jgi:hypothetical protein
LRVVGCDEDSLLFDWWEYKREDEKPQLKLNSWENYNTKKEETLETFFFCSFLITKKAFHNKNLREMPTLLIKSLDSLSHSPLSAIMKFKMICKKNVSWWNKKMNGEWTNEPSLFETKENLHTNFMFYAIWKKRRKWKKYSSAERMQMSCRRECGMRNGKWKKIAMDENENMHSFVMKMAFSLHQRLLP